MVNLQEAKVKSFTDRMYKFARFHNKAQVVVSRLF